MPTDAVEPFRAWLQEVGLSAWTAVLDHDLADPALARALTAELTLPSRWEARVIERGRLDVVLVDVLPSAPGWTATPLTPADAHHLQRALHTWTGLPVHVVLRGVSADYDTLWGATVREVQGHPLYTPGLWVPPDVDPDTPWLATFAAREDAAGRRVVVSASGGLPDRGAWIGNTARPMTASATELYAHELLHALGHGHHYAPGLYAPGADRRDGRPWLLSTDCILSVGYVGGTWRGGDDPRADDAGVPKMAPLLCPICRYRLHPRPARAWARRYLRGELFPLTPS